MRMQATSSFDQRNHVGKGTALRLNFGVLEAE